MMRHDKREKHETMTKPFYFFPMNPPNYRNHHQIMRTKERNARMMKIRGRKRGKLTRMRSSQKRFTFVLIAAAFILLMLPIGTIFSSSIISGTASSFMTNPQSERMNSVTRIKTDSLDAFSSMSAPQKNFEALFPEGTSNDERNAVGEPKLPETLDVGKLFRDNLADYQKVWEPWLSKAAIHDIEISDDGEFFLVAGGYLYDNEIHVYRWNEQLNKYVRVWETGDQIIKSDVFSVTMGDTDNNNFIEVAGASADGHVYVFEQTHIYDPFTRTETRFDLVWKSPYLKQAWGVKIADTDKDFIKDLIVASWDGYIRWYEYRDHSGYPFSKEHWIEYREVFKAPVEGHPQSIAITDLNGNGLDEVIVGTREGWIQVFENNGTVIDIEGEPFPLSRDNNYQLIWRNNESLWYPIMKMDTGQLDDDRAQEVVLTARGQGVFVLDYDPEIQEFVLNKLTTPLESWETPSTGAGYPLDHYVDWMLNSSGNVYGWDGRSEPDNNNYADSPTIYPYNTALAQEPDNNYTLFDASATGSVASAVLDFGNDEELTGDGRPGAPESKRGYDLYVYFSPTTPPIPSRMTFYLSADGKTWEEIPSDDLLAANTTMLMINVDGALAKKQWSGARYLNITVHSNGYFKIDAMWTRLLDRPLDTATSAIIGRVNQQWDSTSTENNIVVGTVRGKILVYHYDSERGITETIFDSYADERYVLGGNVWDIAQIPVNQPTIVPTFLAIGNNFMANLTDIFGGTTTIADMMTWAKLHQVSDVKPSAPDYINQKDLVITSSGTAFILRGDDYTYATDLTNRYFGYINLLGAATLSIAFSTESSPQLYGIPRLAAVAYVPAAEPTFYNPTNPSVLSTARIALYRITSPSSAYTHLADLTSLETTHYIKSILQKSQILPTMAFGDLDKDGYEDLVIANGKLYLVKNRGINYELDQEYFKDINTRTSNIYKNPQLVDFDQDGDLDLVLAYHGKPGLAYWVNIGTPTSPKWEFRRQDLINLNADTNFAYNNFTLFTVEHGDQLNETRRIAAFQIHSTQIGIFQPDFETHDSFIVGINPKISRIDINLRHGTDRNGVTRKNFGYRILETWNTEGELKTWTQSISIADLDGDGRREVIAGDFDNNIYVFEHLTNNTYKRAYRSPDLAQKINTTESPYAHEQLLGISASFIRFEWQHVNLLTAGSDLDRDGRTEIIATAGLTIYIFEFTGRDDHYQLVWTTDLGATIWRTIFSRLGITQFTALKTSVDMNYNGRGEFLAAAGPFLFIFESQGDNVFREIFMDSSLRMLLPGVHYYLPENGLLYFYTNYDGSKMLTINDVAVGNFIKDTNEQEIIVVGEINTIWGQKDGFGYIMRNTGSTFYHLGEFDKDIVKNNPIYAIEVDDPDYDGQPDLIIGHEHGVDVLEIRTLTSKEIQDWLNDNGGAAAAGIEPPTHEIVVQARLTSSPNHPYISPLYALNNESVGVVFPPQIANSEIFLQFFKDYGVIFNVDQIDTRSTEILALHTSLGLPGYPGYLDAGDIIQVFSKRGRLHWAVSRDNGASWQQQGVLFYKDNYTAASILGTEYKILKESDPALYQAPNGNIFLTFSLLAYNTLNNRKYSYIILAEKTFRTYAGSINPWTLVDSIASADLTFGTWYQHPSVWMDPIDPLSTSSLGISYLNYYNSSVYFVRYTFGNPTTGSSAKITLLNIVPFIGTGVNKTFQAYSIDALYQSYGIGKGRYVLAFSGVKYREAKGDLDIWVTTADLNFNWTNPVRVSSNSQTTDAFPDLTQLYNDQGTLMVVWELQERTVQGEIGVSYSKDGGITWRETDTLASIPEFMEYRYFPLLGIALPVWRIFPSVVFGNFLVTSPTITALPSGGFTYSYIASYDAFLLQVVPVDKKYLTTSAAQFAASSQSIVKLVPFTPPAADYSYYKKPVTSTPSRTPPSANVSYSIGTLGYGSLSAISTGLTLGSINTGTTYSSTFIPIFGQVSVESILSSQGTHTALTTTSSGSSNDDNSASSGDYASSNFPMAYVPKRYQETNYPSKVEGTYRNIFVGRNFKENWLHFDFFEASNIAVGDSDGDNFREIALTSRDKAYLTEMIGNTNRSKFYRQTWMSQSFDIPLTDIQLYDANGNGFEEVIISGEGGNIYSFEIDDLTLTQAPFQFLTVSNETKFNWKGTSDANLQTLAAFDLNRNGIDELLVVGLDANNPTLRMFLDGNPHDEISLPLYEPISSFNYLDLNDDGIVDILSIGLTVGGVTTINLTQTMLDKAFSEMAPTVSLGEKIVDILFWENPNAPLNWSQVIISGDKIQLYDVGSSSMTWELDTTTHLTGNTLLGGMLGTFLPTSGRKSLAVVDEKINVLLIDLDSPENMTTISTLNNGNLREALFTASDLNDDGFDDIILALDNEQLIALDTKNESILWSRQEDFGVTEQFKALKTIDLNEDGKAETYLISDSGYEDVLETIIRTSFEQDPLTLAYLQPGTPFSQVNLSNIQSIIGDAQIADSFNITSVTYLQVGFPYPTEGLNVLLGPTSASTGEFGLVFKNLVSRIRFRIFFDSSKLPTIQLFMNETFTKPIHEITLNASETPLTVEFRASEYNLTGFKAFKIIPNGTPEAYFWYMDELEMDVLQPSVFIRRYDVGGNLEWQHSLGAQTVNSFIINDNPEGLVSPVGLLGLAVNDTQVETENDARGFLGFDLIEGHPTFYSGLQLNTMGGITGKMSDSIHDMPIDGTFFLMDGTMFTFQFLDQLKQVSLENVSISTEADWNYKLSSPIEFVRSTDLNQDGIEDIIAATSDGYVYALDGTNPMAILWKTRLNPRPTSLVIGDFVKQLGINDVFIAFADGTYLVLNGSNGLTAWRGVSAFHRPTTAINIGDRDGDGFDDIILGTALRLSATTFGSIIQLSGFGDGSGNKKIISQRILPAPTKKVQLASDGTNDFIVALGTGGFVPHVLMTFILGTGGTLTTYGYNVTHKFMDFAIVHEQIGGGSDGIVTVTLDGKVIIYDTIKQFALGISFNLGDLTDLTGTKVTLPFMMQPLDTLNWTDIYAGDIVFIPDGFDDTIVIGLLGFGYVAMYLDGIVPGGGFISWIFKDASVRVQTQSESALVDYHPDNDGISDILVRNGEIAYILNGNSGKLQWLSSLPEFIGDILTFDTMKISGKDEIIIGTELGHILRFNLSNTNPSASITAYVPWYPRYHNSPLTPAAVIPNKKGNTTTATTVMETGNALLQQNNDRRKPEKDNVTQKITFKMTSTTRTSIIAVTITVLTTGYKSEKIRPSFSSFSFHASIVTRPNVKPLKQEISVPNAIDSTTTRG